MRTHTLLFLATLAAVSCKKKEAEEKAGQPTAAQQPVADDTKQPVPEPPPTTTEVKGEEIEYKAGDVTMKGYLAYDPTIAEKRPGILVVHEWWGHNDYARKRAEMLAGLGYTAFAVDMYGDGKTAEHPEDAQKFAMAVSADFDAAKARFEAAHELLDAHETTDPDRTAAVGYCMGGSIALNMARAGADLDVVAAFHAGNLSRPEALPAVTENAESFPKVMVFHGAADPFVKPEAIEAFKAEMTALGVEPTFVAYEGAVHAFTNPGATAMGEKFELPLAYNEAADTDSWEQLKRGLNEAFE